jgi:hypothetical protein
MDLVSYQGPGTRFFEVAPKCLENMWLTCDMYAHHQFLWHPVLDSSLAYFKWSSKPLECYKFSVFSPSHSAEVEKV